MRTRTLLGTAAIVLTFLSPFAGAQVRPELADQIVTDVDRSFRSSNRYVPALDLYSASYQAIDASLLRRLHQLTRTELVESLLRLQGPLQLNRGVAENLIKIFQFTQLCGNQEALTPTLEQQRCDRVTADSVSGLPQLILDQLVEPFPVHSAIRAGEWDYNALELSRLALREGTDNDWYKFKMAAVIFNHGLHKSKRVVYNMLSRGKENRAYYVIGGTSLVLDALPYFHFSEREIQYLKNHPQFKRVSDEFFDYLRTWRFKGKIRAVPEGTVLFPNETIMEIDTDPLSATLVECLLSPIIDTVTTSATKMARVVTAANGLPVVEGGTRRSGHALLGAYGALIGMVAGSSNTKISRLLDTLPYGSMEHALFGLFGNEIRTMTAYDQLFPNSTMLIDENEIMEGLRNAIRVAGPGLGGARTDSEMENIGLAGTTRSMRDLLDDLDLFDPKILISNRINEFTLDELKPGETAHQGVLVGTEAQNPSDVNGSNIVFKLVEVTDQETGEVTPIAKRSVGKVGIPGRTENWRVYKPVDPESISLSLKLRATEDVISVKDEVIEGGVPLLREALAEDGKRLLVRESMADKAARTGKMVSELSPEVLDIHARKGIYPVYLSPMLQKKQADLLRKKQEREYLVGVQIGSFDPVTDAHVEIARRARRLYSFDRTLVVPTNQTPIHGKTYKYSAEERLEMLRGRYNPLGIEVDDREVYGTNRYTIDTLREIQAEVLRAHPLAKIFVVVGDDVFADLTDPTENSKWTRDQYPLLNEGFSWIVSKRTSSGEALNIPSTLLSSDWERLSPRLYENNKTGAVIELVDLKVGEQVSSTRERELASQVDTIFHGVDLQWSFWEALNGRPPGPMAVSGSAAITNNVLRLTRIAKDNPRVKSILTKDHHYEIERRDAKWNGEFHGQYAFPPHGMAERSGPAGHEILWEVQSIFPPEKKINVPHNYEVKGVDPDLDSLQLKPFNLEQFAHQLVSPNTQVVLHKNGPRSYDFGVNPRARAVVDRIHPQRVIVYGVATDFCVVKAVMRYREWGYDVWLVTDAIAGIFPAETEAAFAKMRAAGVRFVTTQEVVDEYELPAKEDCEVALENKAG